MTNLASHLHNRNTPCPRCDYNLRNLTTDRCPECGEIITLENLLAAQARRTNPLDWPWLLTILALFAHWKDSLRALWFLAHGQSSYGDMFATRTLFRKLTYILSTSYWSLVFPLGIALLFLRRPFSRLPALLRWIIALAALLLFIFAHHYLWQFFPYIE